MEPRELRRRVERFVRRHGLVEPGGEVTVLVSAGADSTCLWHALRELRYRVSALHVDHGLRGAESDEDARFCRERFGAEVVNGRTPAPTEDELRRIRYSFATDRLRATGHTASDQVETVLYRLVSSGRAGGIERSRGDGVVRPLLEVWRDDTRAYCDALGLEYRDDTSNPGTKRGLIRDELLPLLRRVDPRAERNLLALATDTERRLPRTLEAALHELLASSDGTKHADLPGGIRATREYDRLSLGRGPVRWGPWLIESDDPTLEVRRWHSGDRLSGRRKKIQDVFTDAKVPRRDRAAWPLVVRGEEVVAVPGIVEDAAVRAVRSEDT